MTFCDNSFSNFVLTAWKLKSERKLNSEHNYHLTEHNYHVIAQKDQIDTDMEYADDISKVTSNHSSMENFKHNTSEILKPRDLNVNHDETEQCII